MPRAAGQAARALALLRPDRSERIIVLRCRAFARSHEWIIGQQASISLHGIYFYSKCQRILDFRTKTFLVSPLMALRTRIFPRASSTFASNPHLGPHLESELKADFKAGKETGCYTGRPGMFRLA